MKRALLTPRRNRRLPGARLCRVRPPSRIPTRLDRKPSWRAAAVYKPVSYGSIYFDYGTSFNPSAEALALTVGPAGTGTANLAPEFNRSYEVGTKWDLNNARFSLRADLFRTTKDNAREASPTNSLLYVLAGTQRVRAPSWCSMAASAIAGKSFPATPTCIVKWSTRSTIRSPWATGWQTCPTISSICGRLTNPCSG